MPEMFIARRSGAITNRETGEVYRIRAGRTTAEAGHPAVEMYPRAWVPVTVHLPCAAADTQDAPRDEVGDAFTRLAAALRGRDVLSDRPLNADEIVDEIMAIVDRNATPDEPPAAGAREDIRSWARANGHEIGDRGRIPQAVVDAYADAHGA